MGKELYNVRFDYHTKGKPKVKHTYSTLAWVEDGALIKDFVQIFTPRNVNHANCVITEIVPTPILTVPSSKNKE